ncbi:MAG: hypothetical protein ACXAEN_23365, partial [Candidatus Thorarchaeota archaeon]
VSSENAAFPRAWLKDPLRSKVWKSKTGWTVVTGYNDKINLTEGTSSPSTALATVAAGTYATGALMANALSSALNAAGENTYVVNYTTSYKFKIGVQLATTTASASIDWASGGSITASIALCLGYNATSDLSRTTTDSTTALSCITQM